MDWSIHEVAKRAGTTSRALRHYDDIGLLAPTRIAANGYRHYDQAALVRLQRILLLRRLGLGLPQIGDVLTRQTSATDALTAHLGLLRQEQDQLARRIAAVAATIGALEEGEEIMPENMFDGFDHTQYRDEVTERWGADAYARSDRWWRALSADEKSAWQQRAADLQQSWRDAAARGIRPDSAEAHALAERHVQWLTGIPGTPAGTPGGDVNAYATGLGEMYVADPRFAAHYGGVEGATFVRDALRAYAAAAL